MENIIAVVFFVIGLIIIIKGGDWFVESAVWVAKSTGIPDVLIGATIVSIATTLPELLVSSIATYQHHYDVAIGNVVGSIVCNIGFILGITAVIKPIEIRRSAFFAKGLFMLFCALLLFFLAKDTIITHGEGNILLFLFFIYVLISIKELKSGENNKKTIDKTSLINKSDSIKNAAKFIFGAVFIIIGSKLLVDNGIAIAKLAGVPEQVVSLTLIALGTSLPELVTAVSSMAKGHQNISAGNILGANILDMLIVIGVSSKLGEQGIVIGYQNIMFGSKLYNIPQTLYIDIPFALLMMIVLIIGGLTKRQISRRIGLMLLLIYFIYMGTLAVLFL